MIWNADKMQIFRIVTIEYVNILPWYKEMSDRMVNIWFPQVVFYTTRFKRKQFLL